MKNLFFLYLNKRTVVTVSSGSTLPVFTFGSAKIQSYFLRDLAFLTRYLQTSNSFIVFSIVQLSGVKVNSLTLSVLPTYINHYISNFLLKFQVAILQLKYLIVVQPFLQYQLWCISVCFCHMKFCPWKILFLVGDTPIASAWKLDFFVSNL